MNILADSNCVGIIAGGGQFPVLVARAARALGLKVIMIGFVGHTDPNIAQEANAFKMFHLGQLTKLIDFFKSHSVVNTCMAGAISKPRALDLRPDWRAAKALFNLACRGDNDLLALVVREMEQESFKIFQAADLVPELLAPEGVLTSKLSDEMWSEVKYGWSIVKALGALDVGQALIVKERMVIAIEAIEGTDAAIIRAANLVGAGCVLIKAIKPKQDGRTDLPAIGLKTIELLVKHKYAGVAYESGKSLFFDLQQSIELAEKHNLLVIGVNANNPELL